LGFRGYDRIKWISEKRKMGIQREGGAIWADAC